MTLRHDAAGTSLLPKQHQDAAMVSPKASTRGAGEKTRALQMTQRLASTAVAAALAFVVIGGIVLLSKPMTSSSSSCQFGLEANTSDDAAFWKIRAEEEYHRNILNRAELLCGAQNVSVLFSPCVQSLARTEGMSITHYLLSAFTAPTYPCPYSRKLGSLGHGGKWVCFADGVISPKPVVYSIGSYGEISFETGVFEILGVETFTFDPFLTEEQKNNVKAADFVNWFDYGIREIRPEDGDATFQETEEQPKLISVVQAMKMLGHDYVDIFKIDCESCEVGMLKTLEPIFNRTRPLFGQVQMEVHSVGNDLLLMQLIYIMENLGYRLFSAEQIFPCPQCYELAYIHETLVLPKRKQ